MNILFLMDCCFAQLSKGERTTVSMTMEVIGGGSLDVGNFDHAGRFKAPHTLMALLPAEDELRLTSPFSNVSIEMNPF